MPRMYAPPTESSLNHELGWRAGVPPVMHGPSPTGRTPVLHQGFCPLACRAATICVMSSESPSAPPATEPVSSLYDTRLPQLSFWRRMQIPVIAAVVIAVIRALGPTLRFEELGMHHYRDSRAQGVPVVSAFWHRCIISA